MSYQDDAIGGQQISVNLEAWSPKIPQMSKESASPVIFFDFTVANAGKANAQVCLDNCLPLKPILKFLFYYKKIFQMVKTYVFF